MQVGELFLALGLFVDEKEWNLGQAVIDKMTAEMKKLAVNAVMATTDVKKAMDVIGLPAVQGKTNLEKIAGAAEHGESAFKRMAIAAASFFALDGMKNAVTEVVDYGSKLNDTAQKTGLSAEQLQYWGYAAKQNSSDLDGVVDGTKKLVKGLGNLSKDGTDPASKGFKALGISLDDPAIKSKNLNGIMMIIANKMSAMPDGIKKSQAAMDLFGKSGEDLIPTLNMGVQGMMEYRKEADDLGVVMSGRTAGSLDDLGDNIDRLKATWMGVKQQAIAALLPMLSETVQKILDWAKANREVIAARIASVIGGVVAALKLMGSVLGFAIDHWQTLVAIFATMSIVKGMMAIVRAIIFFQSAQAAAAAESIGAWIAILGPILLVAAAVVALGALIYVFRDKIWAALKAIGGFFADIGRSIANIFEGVWHSITSAAGDVWSALKSGFESAFDYISNLPVIHQLFELVKRIDDLMGGSNAPPPDAQGYDTFSKNEHADLLKAHPEIAGAWGGLEGNGPESFDALNPGYMGATSGAASGPLGVNRPGGAGATVQNSYSVVVNAGSADAKETAVLVDQKLREHDERTRRQTAASLGI